MASHSLTVDAAFYCEVRDQSLTIGAPDVFRLLPPEAAVIRLDKDYVAGTITIHYDDATVGQTKAGDD